MMPLHAAQFPHVAVQGDAHVPAPPRQGSPRPTSLNSPPELARRPVTDRLQRADAGTSPSPRVRSGPRAVAQPAQSLAESESFVDVPLHEFPAVDTDSSSSAGSSWRERVAAWLVPPPAGFAAPAPSAGAGHLGRRGTDSPTAPEPTVEQVLQQRQALMNTLREFGAQAGVDPHGLAAAPVPTAAVFDLMIQTLVGNAPEPTTAEERAAVSMVMAFVADGEIPPQSPARNPGHITLARHLIRQVGLGAGVARSVAGAAGSMLRAGHMAKAFLQRVNANENFESTPAKVAASVANVAMRNALAVFLPTLIRQFLSYGIEAGLTRAGASDSARTTLGLVAPMLAVGALLMGAMRDRMAGTYTRTSERSRAIMATTTAVAGLATAATGAMPGVASLMVAFTAYTAMRDLLVHPRLRMANANTSDYVPDATHFALISAGYGLDQGLVSLGMSLLASPSGADAYLKHAGVQAWNAIRRGALNWAGEVAEDLMFQGIPAVRSTLDPAQPSHALQLSIRDVGYQQNHVVNGALGPWAVRTGILTATIGGLSMLSAYAKDPSYANNPRLVEAVGDLIIGAVNGILYEPFANAGSAQPSTAPGLQDSAVPFDSNRFAVSSRRLAFDPEASQPDLLLAHPGL